MNKLSHLKTSSYSAAILATATLCEPSSFGQGCVQSRGAGIGTLMQGEDIYLPAGSWQASLGYRWLESDRHFVGGREQPQRQALGTDVRNHSHFFDLTGTYGVTKRLSLNLTVPFVHSDRSSFYEHGDGGRHTTSAGGLADVRLLGSFWIFDPEQHHEGNVAFGVGIKAPTGDSFAKDIKYKRDPITGVAYQILDKVDQSIQPGDGGWGVAIEVQGFQKIVKDTYAYAYGSYLINPQERNPDTGYSIPDSYLFRAGLSYSFWPSQGLSVSLGGRMEGVPTEDWFGGSEGGRRPGYSISIEPGITWVNKKWAVTVTAPVALDRNREKSVSDLRNGTHGDAAFADYILTGSVSYRF